MTTLWGMAYPRAELMRRVGRLDQIAGVRLVTLGEGAGRGVRLLEPGETRRYDLEIGGLVGSAEIEAFAGRVERLHPVPA